MEFKIQLPNAVNVFLLIFLLFWCLTRNLPNDFYLYSEKHPTSSIKGTALEDKRYNEIDATSSKIGKSDDDKRDLEPYVSRNIESPINPPSILIPPFKEWRKMEMAKHEESIAKDKFLHQHKKLIRRKLNYASSKCGAKILSSNPESRHRMAVLSEKSDEYFLNPCRVTTWFIVELCDAVEAAQVELANYELYSSSPKQFSVFSSDVYPTFLWHPLGTFVAEDKRTMQTFDVREKSMGKFIKVIIHSHHGKEHYCPLSVFRVLGFSMVETLEEIENDDHKAKSDFGYEEDVELDKTPPPKKRKVHQTNDQSEKFYRAEHTIQNSYTKYFCEKLFTHCSNTSYFDVHKVSLNTLACQILEEIMERSKTNCLDFYCPRHPELFLRGLNSTSLLKLKTDFSYLVSQEKEKTNNTFNDYTDVEDIIKDYEHKKSLRIKEDCKCQTYAKLDEKDKMSYDNTRAYKSVGAVQKPDNDDKQNSDKHKYICDKNMAEKNKKCIFDKDKCQTEAFSKEKLTLTESFPQERKKNDEDNDSAGLISKESVLFKLSAKIRASETDLNLINKYLQQLSQSYRYMIEGMKTKLNKTFQKMTDESEKITDVNIKQEENILLLKGKIEILSRKVNFLMQEKNGVTKRVIEFHAFFLILEIIILAAVFNIFLNIFYKKNRFHQDSSINYNN